MALNEFYLLTYFIPVAYQQKNICVISRNKLISWEIQFVEWHWRKWRKTQSWVVCVSENSITGRDVHCWSVSPSLLRSSSWSAAEYSVCPWRTHARLKGVKLTHFVADCTPSLRQPFSVPLPRRLSAVDLSWAAAGRELSLGGRRSNDSVESRSPGRHPSPMTRPVDTARRWICPRSIRPDQIRYGLEKWREWRTNNAQPLCLNCLTSPAPDRLTVICLLLTAPIIIRPTIGARPRYLSQSVCLSVCLFFLCNLLNEERIGKIM